MSQYKWVYLLKKKSEAFSIKEYVAEVECELGTQHHDLYLFLHTILPIFPIILALYLTILPLLAIVPHF